MTTQRIISILIILSLLASPVLPAWGGTTGCGGGEETEARVPHQGEEGSHDHAGHDHGGHGHEKGHGHDAAPQKLDHGSHSHDHDASTVPTGVPSASAPVVCCSDNPYVLAGAIGVATAPASSHSPTTPFPALSFLSTFALLWSSPALKGRYKIGSSPPQAASDRYTYLRLSVFRI